ncbi:gasdermin-B-like [Microtus oregoni]|uniref:gasdermin-B-like n=1 Tax=Microtus oregoni TaxID=111838 RepID=UPI001BB20543|nr:gasdermin-B-like [Microtus oregoni]
MSVFESVTRSLVQELDSGGDMIPVKSMVDAGAFKCGYLVRGRKRFWRWSFYHKTDLTLEDILDEKDEGLFGRLPAGFRGEKAKFQVQDKTDSKLSLKLSSAILPAKLSTILPAKFPEEILAVERLRSCDWKTTIIHRKLTQRYLDLLVNKKVKQKLPASFKTINMKENIYLVTETLETEEEETLQREMDYKILSSFFMDSNYESKRQRKITVPANMILAYRMKQLIFKNGSIFIDFWNERRRGSFQGEMPLGRQGTTGTLKEHVENTGRSLQELDEKQKNVLCSATTCAIKEGGLEDLEQKVSAVLFSDASMQTEGPAGPLIRTLHDNAGCLVEARAEAILMLLDALIALSNIAKYVNEALENGNLRLLKDQVESILQKNWGDRLRQVVRCDPEARTFCILYIACSLLQDLNPNKSTRVCS